MAEVARSESSSPETDKDFDPSADMMVHDYDDERTLDEEEAMTSGESCTGELDDLQKESEMPLEELLAHYASGSGPMEENADTNSSSSTSNSEEEILESQNLTLDKEVISRELLNNGTTTEDRDISVNELIQNVSRSQTERLLRSTIHPGSDDSESSSEDDNYEPVEEHKKTIQVGSDFQAVIPVGLTTYDDAPAYENEDRLLWDPSKIKDESALNDYLCNVQREVDKKLYAVASIPRGKHIRDDEQALFLLLQCDNNIEEAERRRKMQAVLPTDVMSLWSEDECRNFEDGLRLYGKNFHEIHHNKVRTRSVFELVHFYYLWKKTERHDIFAAKTRAEKRKYSLNPGVIDHMDRFLEEQEVELNQALMPQAADTKSESVEEAEGKPSEDVFATGKTTIVPIHVDRSPARHEHGSGGTKRLLSSTDFNGTTGAAESPLKKQRLDNLSELSPKKIKVDQMLQESPSKKSSGSSSTSPLPSSSLPPAALCEGPTKPESASDAWTQQRAGGSPAASACQAEASASKDNSHLSSDPVSSPVVSVESPSKPSCGPIATATTPSRSVSSAGDSLSSDITPRMGTQVSAV